MKSNRRNFLKLSGLTGVGLSAGNIFKAFAGNDEKRMKQMELLSHDFFVFENAETGEVNVLYRREDGNYGILEPER